MDKEQTVLIYTERTSPTWHTPVTSITLKSLGFDLNIANQELWPILNQVDYSRRAGGHLVNKINCAKHGGFNWALDGSLLRDLFYSIFHEEHVISLSYGALFLEAEIEKNGSKTKITICDEYSLGLGGEGRAGGSILFSVHGSRGNSVFTSELMSEFVALFPKLRGNEPNYCDYFCDLIDVYLNTRIPAMTQHVICQIKNTDPTAREQYCRPSR